MNAYYGPDFRGTHLQPHHGDMKPMGVFLAQWLGPKVYTLGMTTFQGQEGLETGGPRSSIGPAPDGSLEARLHALGSPYAFLDFRLSEGDHRNPVRAVQTVRIPKFESITVSDIGRIYDGLFFIDRMAPATHI